MANGAPQTVTFDQPVATPPQSVSFDQGTEQPPTDPQAALKQKYGLPPTADLSKGFFDPANKGIHDPEAFTNAYQEFHANDPKPGLWDEVKSWVGHALAPYEGAMAPRTPEEMLSPAEMIAGEGAGTAATGIIGEIAENGLGNTIAQTLREPYTGKLKPALRNPVPILPKMMQPNIPDWMVPQGEEGTITNPVVIPKGQEGTLAPGMYYKPSAVRVAQPPADITPYQGPSSDLFYKSKAAFMNQGYAPADEAAAAARAKPSSGVLQVPEPNPLAPGEKPGTMYSVPRQKLVQMALTGKPGAADVLRDLGKPMVVIPRGADIESPSLPISGDLPNARSYFEPSFTSEDFGGGSRQVSLHQGGQQQGYVMYDIDPNGKASVSSSLIADQLQGQGLGTRMYEKAIEDAQANGAKQFTSGTAPEPGAVRVWKSLGKKYNVRNNNGVYSIPLVSQ